MGYCGRKDCERESFHSHPYPPLTQQPVLILDALPDEGYPLRILRAYRQHCNCLWEVERLSEEERHIYDLMNVHQQQRAEILDRAIERLQRRD